jgi:hypothetical protein
MESRSDTDIFESVPGNLRSKNGYEGHIMRGDIYKGSKLVGWVKESGDVYSKDDGWTPIGFIDGSGEVYSENDRGKSIGRVDDRGDIYSNDDSRGPVGSVKESGEVHSREDGWNCIGSVDTDIDNSEKNTSHVEENNKLIFAGGAALLLFFNENKEKQASPTYVDESVEEYNRIVGTGTDNGTTSGATNVSKKGAVAGVIMVSILVGMKRVGRVLIKILKIIPRFLRSFLRIRI